MVGVDLATGVYNDVTCFCLGACATDRAIKKFNAGIGKTVMITLL